LEAKKRIIDYYFLSNRMSHYPFDKVPLMVGCVLFLEMFGALVWNVTTVSYRQRFIPDQLLGRVNSLHRFFGWGFMSFGALLEGWLAA
jgi:hypothetical protein